jgi:hypothetical protein
MNRLRMFESALNPVAAVAVLALGLASIVFSQNVPLGSNVKISDPPPNPGTAAPNQGSGLNVDEAILFDESILRALWR